MADHGNSAGFRLRHTMIRVEDLEKSVAFYTDLLGMTLMRRRVSDERGETVAYVGYGDEETSHALEIVEEHSPPPAFRHGNTYGHVALGVPDVAALSEALMEAGVEFTIPPQLVREGSPNKLAFIKDPDGYEIELTERH
ncbi:MAG: lactoylglutathione lyase [Rhodospirillaceae bacterium]|jgi:lactoylglutathione lyase|nr:lactoylglutathione lyase [Rhodospirillaceae bacterium]